MYIDESII